ncbi:MAG: glycoside hydrolase family 16 protein [Thermoguttaceae bacterium]|nr:glycoside hydrolase family 16 protein [Thermoguttaceae bacterium]
MRRLLQGVIIFAMCLCFLSMGHAAPPADGGPWDLTFEDNFEGSTLESQKWFAGYRLGRMDYYTRIGFPNEHGRQWQPKPPIAHYQLKDGVLKLRIDREIPKRDTPSCPCVSALTTAIYQFDEKTGQFNDQVKFQQKYGWFEIRCRVPRGMGSYTAFWLHQVGANNQEYTPEGKRKGLADGVVEIDIFELLASQIDSRLNNFNIHFTPSAHYVYKMSFDPSVDFHTWALHWEEGRITWYCDGKVAKVYEGPTPPKQMYVLVALFQVGGWAGAIDKNMVYPLDFEIDYIRVWKKRTN